MRKKMSRWWYVIILPNTDSFLFFNIYLWELSLVLFSLYKLLYWLDVNVLSLDTNLVYIIGFSDFHKHIDWIWPARRIAGNCEHLLQSSISITHFHTTLWPLADCACVMLTLLDPLGLFVRQKSKVSYSYLITIWMQLHLSHTILISTEYCIAPLLLTAYIARQILLSRPGYSCVLLK